MELLFLGTGAADWNISKRVEGEFFRRFSSALVDGALLIDLTFSILPKRTARRSFSAKSALSR